MLAQLDVGPARVIKLILNSEFHQTAVSTIMDELIRTQGLKPLSGRKAFNAAVTRTLRVLTNAGCLTRIMNAVPLPSSYQFTAKAQGFIDEYLATTSDEEAVQKILAHFEINSAPCFINATAPASKKRVFSGKKPGTTAEADAMRELVTTFVRMVTARVTSDSGSADNFVPEEDSTPREVLPREDTLEALLGETVSAFIGALESLFDRAAAEDKTLSAHHVAWAMAQIGHVSDGIKYAIIHDFICNTGKAPTFVRDKESVRLSDAAVESLLRYEEKLRTALAVRSRVPGAIIKIPSLHAAGSDGRKLEIMPRLGVIENSVDYTPHSKPLPKSVRDAIVGKRRKKQAQVG